MISSRVLERLGAAGIGLVLATHDVDLAWALCEEPAGAGRGEAWSPAPWDFGGAGGLRRPTGSASPFWWSCGGARAAPGRAADAGRGGGGVA